ncbi:MAG: hypothetical protein R2798_03025 [Chitinophagales bacterium]|nr:hypothetical protein [Bacteroidota bacterium]MCB9042303.1 hypothetical protein [Chitinophagales bacterium]
MFKNLKSLFVVDDENKVATPENKTSENQSENTPENTTTTPQSADAPPTQGSIDDNIINTLLQAFEKNNLEGFDYLEYKKSLQALAKMPIDEATKFRTAFATASTMGLTFPKLIETANYYQQILNKEKAQFEQALRAKNNDGVEQKLAVKESLQKSIAEKSEAIKQLTQEIQTLQTKIESIDTDIADVRNKLETTRLNFEASYDFIAAQLEGDIKKMNEYLK